MKTTFKGFITEQTRKGNISFLHPVKGIYKMTHHADTDVYHVHNKFGDLTHTYSGHMSPEEVANELKQKHEMILIDKLHEEKEILDELAKKPMTHEQRQERDDSAAINTHRGGYNETQLAKHLNGGKYIDKDHEHSDKHHKAHLEHHDKKYGTQEVKNQEGRAKEQSKVYLEHAKKLGYHGVKKVHLVSKPGEIESKMGIKASQQENPTDVGVEFHHKPKTAKHSKHGISAKSSSKSAIGFHNGGSKEIGHFLTKHLG